MQATRREPWDHILHAQGQGQGQYMTFYAALCSALEAERRPEITAVLKEAHPAFVALMQTCWANEPASRPRFTELVLELSKL